MKLQWLLEFLKGVDNEPSSKRLMGAFSGFCFCLLCLGGGVFILRAKEFEHFDDLLWVLGPYSLALLGAGVIERKAKIDARAKDNVVTANNTVIMAQDTVESSKTGAEEESKVTTELK